MHEILVRIIILVAGKRNIKRLKTKKDKTHTVLHPTRRPTWEIFKCKASHSAVRPDKQYQDGD